MELNTMSGRSYNDITQYPVFPWIISNYESAVLDLSDPSNFRDLSKPIGALSEEKAQKSLERYQQLQSDKTMPAFHYGSHYSSAGAVLHYLLRLEPFTSQFLCLQSGRFDYPNRQFTSIPATWRNCTLSGTDVKELIPEFFYQPEFLVNNNGFDLGKTTRDNYIDDVVLPAWAKTPQEFIFLHRQALESEYVSQNLHHWIDLIFGYQQTGEEAAKAMNVFYYLTYEGTIDLNSLDDPIYYESVRTQIENFGQTPTQLLRTPHPRRQPLSIPLNALTIPSDQVFISTQVLIQQLPFSSPYFVFPFKNKIVTVNYFGEYLSHDFKWESEQYSAIDLISAQKDQVNGIPFRIDIDPIFSTSQALPTTLQNQNKAGAGFILSLKNFSTGNRRFNSTKFPDFDPNEVPPNPLFLVDIDGSEYKAVTVGNYDNSIRIEKLDTFEYGTQTLKCYHSVNYHTQEICCVSRDHRWLVCGTVSGVVSVWRCASKVSVLSYLGQSVSSSLRTMAKGIDTMIPKRPQPSGSDWIIEQPTFVLYQHAERITAVAINKKQCLIVSCCIDGNLAIHNLDNGQLMQCINHEGDDSLSLLKISSDGKIAVHSSKKSLLYLYSMNGNLIALRSLTEGDPDDNKLITDMIFTSDSKFLITSGKFYVSVRRVSDLCIIHQYKKTDSQICSVRFDEQERILFVSTIDGKLIMYYKQGGVKLLP